MGFQMSAPNFQVCILVDNQPVQAKKLIMNNNKKLACQRGSWAGAGLRRSNLPPKVAQTAPAVPLQKAQVQVSTKFLNVSGPELGEQRNEQIPGSSRCGGHAAGTSPSPTSKVLLFIPRKLGIISRRPCPRVLPRRHATQRARSEIFKLSLPTGQSNSWNEKLKFKLMGGGEIWKMNVKVVGARVKWG